MFVISIDGVDDYLEFNAYSNSESVSDDIEIYNALSPNGDGLNDVLVIRTAEKYPENELIIFNRWGKVLFQTKNYGQPNRFFNGRNNKGEELPVGVYYYKFSYQKMGTIYNKMGYVYINR